MLVTNTDFLLGKKGIAHTHTHTHTHTHSFSHFKDVCRPIKPDNGLQIRNFSLDILDIFKIFKIF